MAHIKLNPLLDQLRGRVGDLVFRRFRGRTVVQRRPDFSGYVPSAAQVAERRDFGRAVAYARAVLADPEARAFYEEVARPSGRKAYHVALADARRAPTVEAIEVAGDVVLVRAEDDVAVTRVEVVLSGADGAVLERGEARMEDGWWRYAVRADVAAGAVVLVRAYDRPGNVGEGMVEVGVGFPSSG